MGPSLKKRVVLLALIQLAACRGVQTLKNACEGDAGACVPCASDKECTIASNECQESAVCAHVEAGVAVAQLGCNTPQYEKPSADRCRCIESACRAVE